MTAPHRTLVDAVSLVAMLAADPHDRPVVVDTRFDLADTELGERQYREGHVPGSFYLHLDRDLSQAKTGRNGRHPLPSRATFAGTVGALGIAPGTQVVALDAHGGVYAARLWWMLRWLGHDAVAILDGGLAAWQRAGGTLTDAVTSMPGGAPYPERSSSMPTIDADGVAARAPRRAVVDARAGERFRGEVDRSTPSLVTSRARSTVSIAATSTTSAHSSRRRSCATSSLRCSAVGRRAT